MIPQKSFYYADFLLLSVLKTLALIIFLCEKNTIFCRILWLIESSTELHSFETDFFFVTKSLLSLLISVLKKIWSDLTVYMHLIWIVTWFLLILDRRIVMEYEKTIAEMIGESWLLNMISSSPGDFQSVCFVNTVRNFWFYLSVLFFCKHCYKWTGTTLT